MKKTACILMALFLTAMMLSGCSSSKKQPADTPVATAPDTADPAAASNTPDVTKPDVTPEVTDTPASADAPDITDASDITDPESNGVITVGTDAATISEAIDKAAEGDVVFVPNR